MTTDKRKRRARKKESYLAGIEDDFRDIEGNFASKFNQEQVRCADLPKEKIEEVSIKKDIESISEITNSDLQVIQLSYEAQISVLKQQVDSLKNSSSNFSRNEEKVLNAIRAESIIQKKEKPIITRGNFKNKYKINERYLGDAIEGLIGKGVIKRKYVKYSPKIKTSEWEILKSNF